MKSLPQLPRGFTLLEILVASFVFVVAVVLASSLFVNTTLNQRRIESLSRVQDDSRFVIELMAQAVRTNGVDYAYYLNPDGNPTTTDDFIPLTTGPISELVTRDANGVQTFYRRIFVGQPQPYIGVCVSPGPCVDDADFRNVTPANVSVQFFRVYIQPGSDPFQVPPLSRSDCRTNQNNDSAIPLYGYDEERGVCTCNPTDLDGFNWFAACWPEQGCESAGSVSICTPVNRQPTVTLYIESRGGSARTVEQATVRLQTTINARIYRR